MLTRLINRLRALLHREREPAPGATDLAYLMGLSVDACDAALRLLGDDLAAFVLEARRADIREAEDNARDLGIETDWAALLCQPAPGCEVTGSRQRMIATTGERLDLIEAMSMTYTLIVRGHPFGAVFRSHADAVRVSWHLYRQAGESEVSDADIFAEYKRAMADASKTVGPHVPEPWPDPPPRK